MLNQIDFTKNLLFIFQGDLEFQVTFRKGPKKTDTMRFSSEWRATLLTEGLRFLQLGGNDSAAAATKVNL